MKTIDVLRQEHLQKPFLFEKRQQMMRLIRFDRIKTVELFFGKTIKISGVSAKIVEIENTVSIPSRVNAVRASEVGDTAFCTDPRSGQNNQAPRF